MTTTPPKDNTRYTRTAPSAAANGAPAVVNPRMRAASTTPTPPGSAVRLEAAIPAL
jgi:hypothetical protein